MTKAEHADHGKTAAKSACCGGHDHAGHDNHAASSHKPDDTVRVLDPVCGMTVDPATSKHRFDYRGETFHFCSAGCRTKFAADPQGYLENRKPKAAVAEGTI